MPDFDLQSLLQQAAQGKVNPTTAPSVAPAMVAPHPAPDGSGATTTLSDADYGKMMGGGQLPQVNLPQITTGGNPSQSQGTAETGILALPAPGSKDQTIDVSGARPVSAQAASSPSPSSPSSPVAASVPAFDVEHALQQATQGRLSVPLQAAPVPQMTGIAREPAMLGSGVAKGLVSLAGTPGDVARGVTALGGLQASQELQGNPFPTPPSFAEPGQFQPLQPFTPQMLAAAPGKQVIAPPSGHNPLDTETLLGLTQKLGLTDRPDLQPQGIAENALNYGGEGMGMVLPSVLTMGASDIPAAARLLGQGAAMGLGSGVGGTVGQAVGGTPGAVIGGMVGGITPALTAEALSRGFNMVAPVTTGARQLRAAQDLAPGNTPQVRAALENPQVLAPGSPATSYQVTGNPFLGTEEQKIANRDPYKTAFAQVRQKQAEAQVAALENVAPKSADVGAVVPWFKGRLERMRAAEAQDAGEQRAVTQNAVDAMGNPIAPHEAGRAVRGAVETAQAPQITRSDRAIVAAQTRAESAVSGIGGEPVENAVQQHGERMRGERQSGVGLQGFRAAARKEADALYDAVDPDKKLVVGNLDPVAETASLLRGDDMPRKGWKLDDDRADQLSDFAAAGRADLAPAEAKVLDFAAGLRNADTFQNLRRLERMAAAAQRSIRSNSTLGVESLPYRRMTELRSAVEDALSEAAGDAAGSDSDVAERLSAIAREEGYGPVAGEAGGTRNERGPGLGETGIPGAGGTEGAGAGGSGTPAGAGTVASETPGSHLPTDLNELERGIYGDLLPKPSQAPAKLVPNLTDEDTEALRAANANYADYKAKYTKGAVGDVLLPSGKTVSGFKTENSGVPAALFAKGQQGAEAADSLIAATGSREAALRILGDYPAYSLRRAAEDMGRVNVEKYDTWMKAHQAVMDKFPELKDSFDTVRKAQAVLDDLKAQRTALDAANPLKNVQDNAAVMGRYVAKGPGGYEAADRLMRDTNDSPAAIGATRDYLASTLRDMAEREGGFDLSAYHKFMRDYGGFLSNPAMADTRAAFEDAAAAQAELERVATQHQKLLDDYQTSVARHFLREDADPVIAADKILSQRDPGQDLADLGRQTSGDAVARESVQKAIIEAMLKKLSSNNLIGEDLRKTSLRNEQTQNLIGRLVGDKLDGPLKAIMTPDQMEALNNVRLDIRRGNMKAVGPRNAEGSQTSFLESARAADEHQPGVGTTIGLMTVAGEVGEKLLDTPWGKVAGAMLIPLVRMARAAGFRSIQDMKAEALLHPKQLSALYARLPATQGEATSRLMAIQRQLAQFAKRREVRYAIPNATRAANENDYGPQQAIQ